MSGGRLLHNLILFGHLLRGLGLDVNPGQMMDLLQALGLVDLTRRPDVYHVMRSLLVHRREDLPLFDQAFDLFWRAPGQRLELRTVMPAAGPRLNRPVIVPPPLREPPADGESAGEEPPADRPPVLEVLQTFSAREALRRRDFSELSADEIAAIRRMMGDLVWRMDERRTRRRQPGRGRWLDLRRTIRHSLRYGGEVLRWARRGPKTKPRPLVVIADVSGSMERYTRLLLHFIYSLTAGLSQPVEAFVFSTRLTRITRQVSQRNVDRALRDVSRAVQDWSGGTRIGEALKTFNFQWGRRVLGRGAVVMIISDGWDRGDLDLLRREMARLRRTCHRLVWLNPLLGAPGYEPLTRGLQTALPYVDDFLPVHNLASLEDLARHLSALGRRR